MKNDYPRKGEVYWVRLDPTDGIEIKKTRPCVVVSSNAANRSELIVVAPITSNVVRILPRIEVKITLAGKPGKVVLRHLRSIDRTKRLGKKIGEISVEELKSIEEVLRILFDL